MNIEIRHDGGHVEAMGHRVTEREGGASEVKRRCLETLSRYSSPPDEIKFLHVRKETQAGSPVTAALAAPQAADDPQPFARAPAAPPSSPAVAAAGERPARGPGVAKAKERSRR